MSRSYHKLDEVNLSCNGPNENIISKKGIEMKIEKGEWIFEEVIFPFCSEMVNSRDNSNGNCNLDSTGNTKCKYYFSDKKELADYFAVPKQ
jgi:hypothetical protein